MKLAVFRDIVDVHTDAELQGHLCHRHQGVFASFWLWHDNRTELSVMINGGDAYLLFSCDNEKSQHSTLEVMTYPSAPRRYIGGQGPTLYCSVSEKSKTQDVMIEFLADNYESTPMSRLYTVRTTDALTVIKDYFITGNRSNQIQWHNLTTSLPEPPKKKRWWQFGR